MSALGQKQTGARTRRCPLSAKRGLMHCNKVHLYSSVLNALSVSVSNGQTHAN